MSTNIVSVDTLYSDARMRLADAAAVVAANKDNLPEGCYLRDLLTYEPDAEGFVEVTDLRWTGNWSGNSYAQPGGPFEQAAAHIQGRIEVVLTWQDGPPGGVRIVDGKLEKPEVIQVLSRAKYGASSTEAHSAARALLGHQFAREVHRRGGITLAAPQDVHELVEKVLTDPETRRVLFAMMSADDESPLTFEPKLNGGRGGATITIAGYSRFVEGRKARELADALDLRRPRAVDLQAAAERRGGQP